MERIRVEGIESAYGKHRVLKGVSFSAEAGEGVGFVGANGCGKSTLLSILAGLKKADGGQILFDGQKAEERLFVRYTGYVPQESNLIPELTVWDNLLLWYDDKEQLKKELTEGILPAMGIEQMRGMRVSKLSGGMHKKVSIACALAGKPPILLLDEPGAALDLPGKAELRGYLAAYKAAGGTVLIATHEETDLELCDRVYALRDGTCHEIDKTFRGEELMARLR